mgnify:CR=1 FL=1
MCLNQLIVYLIHLVLIYSEAFQKILIDFLIGCDKLLKKDADEVNEEEQKIIESFLEHQSNCKVLSSVESAKNLLDHYFTSERTKMYMGMTCIESGSSSINNDGTVKALHTQHILTRKEIDSLDNDIKELCNNKHVA